MKQLTNKLILILALSFVGVNALFSQTKLLNPPEIYLGLSAGANASYVNFNPYVEQKSFLGAVDGVTFRYVTEKHFGLQLEVNYSQRGWQEKSGEYIRQIDYLEIPFLSHFYLGEKNRLIFNVGPKGGFLLKENVLKNTVINSALEQHILVTKSRFDYGIEAGLGYNLKTKKAGLFQFEMRGYYALSDIFSNNKVDYFDTSNYLNFGVRIGWLFQLTGKEK